MLHTEPLALDAPPELPDGSVAGDLARIGAARPASAESAPHDDAAALDDELPVEWSEQDIVVLHWRLLKEIGDLQDPETPLEEKLNTLRWIFTEREKDNRPFSFASCLRVVGCSPLSPTPYFGFVEPNAIREAIGRHINSWLRATLERYPAWVREAVFSNPEWVESRLEKNPQWINEQVKKHTTQDDLFT